MHTLSTSCCTLETFRGWVEVELVVWTLSTLVVVYYIDVLHEKGHCNTNLLIHSKTVFTGTCPCVQFQRFNE